MCCIVVYICICLCFIIGVHFQMYLFWYSVLVVRIYVPLICKWLYVCMTMIHWYVLILGPNPVPNYSKAKQKKNTKQKIILFCHLYIIAFSFWNLGEPYKWLIWLKVHITLYIAICWLSKLAFPQFSVISSPFLW